MDIYTEISGYACKGDKFEEYVHLHQSRASNSISKWTMNLVIPIYL